jgi:uncharacterized heparinase superfamily protein
MVGFLHGLAPRAERAWHTFRHVPADQLLRRVELTARYHLGSLIGRGIVGPAPPLAPAMPKPPFPARDGLMSREAQSLILRLPWAERSLPRPLPWRHAAAASEGSTRADTNNLHYMEYLESVDDGLFAELVEDWIAANPPGAADAWRYAWRPYNLSVRVSVWLEEIARRGRRLPQGTLDRAAVSLAAQLRYLERHLETDLRGNHLIKNIRALAWGGACFAGPEAARWTELARALVRRELAEQVLPDGCHYERSPAYHCQVMSDLLACRAAFREPLPELDAALDRMARALTLLTHPDGQIAPFNDGGLSMAPKPAELAAVHVALGGMAAVPVTGAFALRDAGYFGLRCAGELLLVDCGPLGPGYLPGHGHCDLLSFEWSTGGRRIVVDQGTHQYMAGPHRLASRSTGNHNTLAIDSTEQSDIYGAFRCGRRAVPEVRSFEAADGAMRLVGSHDGYDRLPGSPKHVRTVAARPGTVEIVDRIEGGGKHTAIAHLLLHPDCKVDARGETTTIYNGPVTVRLVASAPLTVQPALWYPDIYVSQPTTRLALPVPMGEAGARMALTTETCA